MLKYIYSFLFFFVPVVLSATPEITKVDIIHATCPLNGQITITITNALGQVQYELERVNAPEGENNFTKGPHVDNFFRELPPGEYVIKVYDASTGANPVVKTGIIVEKKYDKAFTMGIPSVSYATGAANNQYCIPNGIITASGTGGTRPYYCKIINTTTGEIYEKTGTSSSTSLQFTGLSDGRYSVEMWDQCGTGALYGNLLTVTGSGTVLSDTKLTGFVYYPTASSTYFYGASSTDCSKLNLQTYYYYSFSVTGLNLTNNSTLTNMNRNYYTRLEYRVEYPLGTYSAWAIANSYATFTNLVTDYDPTIDQFYRIQVRNPCRPDSEILTSETFTIPKVSYSFSTSSVGPVYSNFCDVPSVGGCYLNVSTSGGLSSYNCGNDFDVVVTSTDEVFNKTYTWTTTSSSISITDLPLGKSYTATIKSRTTGSTITTLSINLTSTPTRPLGLTAAALRQYETGYNYGRNCDFNTHALYAYLSTSTTYLDYTGSYYSMNVSNPVTYTIVEAPDGVSRSPITRSGSGLLWTDLPDGTYKIKVDYGCRSEIFEKVIKTFVTGFDAKEPVVQNSGVCDNNSISVQGYFHNNGTVVTGSNYDSYDYYYYMRVFNSQGTVVGTSSMTSSNGTAQVSGLTSGKYTVRFYAYRNSNSSNPCYYDKQFIVDIPKYYSPSVDISQSGGISCTVGGKASFTVSASGSNSPFKYRYKVKGASDDTYSAWQTANVFPDLYPGQYTVQIWNTCSAYITQDLTLYDSGQQFVGLVGYVGDKEDGAICEGKEARITVLSIGPVHSYQWFKDGVELAGETGPQYIIPSASESDKGEYKVRIFNGSCYLESAVHIINVLPPAPRPGLSASECLISSSYVKLTAQTSLTNPAYQWFRNGEIISGASASTYNATKPGVYQLTVTPYNQCPSEFSNAVTISLPELHWRKDAANYNWNDINNWLDNSKNPAETLPCSSTTVYIPAGAQTYPSLLNDEDNTPTDTYGQAVCQNIVFEYGAELAYPHLLTYEKARVQYNWGYYGSLLDASYKQQANMNYYGTGDLYKKLRNGWYALAAPLKKMASGDFAFAGYPMSWQALFNAPNPTTGKIQTGDFSKNFAKNDIDLSTTNNAIAVKVAAYDNNTGYKDQKNLEGLKGILEVPYFENTAIAPYKTGHYYDPVAQESKLYYFNTATLQPVHNPVGSIKRGSEAYRFIFEDENNKPQALPELGQNVVGYRQKVSIAEGASQKVMIGNPFVSSINMYHFHKVNGEYLSSSAGYDLFSGTTQQWESHSYTTNSYVGPLQAFVITLKDGIKSAELLYPLSGSIYNMTAGGQRGSTQRFSEGIALFAAVKSTEGQESSYAALKLSETDESDKNIQKMVFPESHELPEVFFVEPALSEYNTVQYSLQGTKELPLGIRSSQTGIDITLTFENVSEFALANRVYPVLIDKALNVKQDLTEAPSYRFTQRATTSAQQYSDVGRFSLSLEPYDILHGQSNTGIRYNNPLLTAESATEVICRVLLYDLQGQLLFSSGELNEKSYKKVLQLAAGVYIVKAETKDGKTKIEKIVVL